MCEVARSWLNVSDRQAVCCRMLLLLSLRSSPPSSNAHLSKGVVPSGSRVNRSCLPNGCHWRDGVSVVLFLLLFTAS